MKKCPKCGAENLDKAQFCAKCGENIKDVELQTAVYVNEEEKTKPSILSWLLPLIVSVVLFVIIFIHFVFYWINHAYLGVIDLAYVLFPMLFAYIDIAKNKNKISILSLSITFVSFLLCLTELITTLIIGGRY